MMMPTPRPRPYAELHEAPETPEAPEAAALRFADEAVQAGVEGLHRRYEAGLELPTQVLQRCLARIARHNPQLNAFVDLDAEGALRDARASDARRAHGRALSALDGVPIGIKANIAVEGLPWTAGIGAWRDRIALTDAPCVARLRAAGALIVGTLNMDEGALGARGDNPWFGRTQNPHRPGLVAAGSSAGAGAAVAAGLCAAALGTDTMGSVRLPAAACGVVGLCPEPGRIDTTDVTPLSWSFDRVGVLARSVRDATAVLRVAASRGAQRLPLASATEGRRIAVLLPLQGVALDVGVAAAFETAVECAQAAGWALMPLRLDGIALPQALKALLLVLEAEGHAVHESLLHDHPEGFSTAFRGMLDWGARQPAGRLAAAYRDLRLWRASLREQLAPFAALLSPGAPQSAFAFAAPTPATHAAYTAIASIAGLPACVLPVGQGVDGDARGESRLPCAVQVVAANDVLAARIAAELARRLPGMPAPCAYID